MGANLSIQQTGNKAIKMAPVRDASGNIQMVQLDDEDNSDYEATVKYIERWKELNDPDEHMSICFASITSLPPLPENLKSLSIKGSNVKEIPEGQLPSTLEYLDVSHTPLEKLPQLPPNLKELMAIEIYCEEFPPFPPSLQKVVCFYTPLKRLPELPEGFEEFDCDDAKLKTVPRLPKSLRKFKVGKCKEVPEFQEGLESLKIGFPDITEWPTNLPKSLKKLDIYCPLVKDIPNLGENLEHLELNWSKTLRSLPEVLPPNLQSLRLFSSDITSLPKILPATLKTLDLSNSGITELPELPDGLDCLNLTSTPITKLPELPHSLTSLECTQTSLTELPTLFHTQLYSLCIIDTKVEKLPELPETLRSIYATRSSLKELPMLPEELTLLRLKDTPIQQLYDEDDEEREWLGSFIRRHNANLLGEPEPDRITNKEYVEWMIKMRREEEEEEEEETDDDEEDDE
jgi:Leucine-rich repeat (LRR) protein